MNGMAGSWVTDSALISGFAYELDLARSAGLLTFEVFDHAVAHRTQNTDFYLQNVRRLALTITGRDRARGRVMRVPLPDPAEDDGRLISHLVLGQIAGAIEQQYSREQAVGPHVRSVGIIRAGGVGAEGVADGGRDRSRQGAGEPADYRCGERGAAAHVGAGCGPARRAARDPLAQAGSGWKPPAPLTGLIADPRTRVSSAYRNQALPQRGMTENLACKPRPGYAETRGAAQGGFSRVFCSKPVNWPSEASR
jgi:hypothetical protein